MYKDDLEAAQARIAALEAEVEAERQRRKASEAETRAIQASLHELQIAAKRADQRAGEAPAPRRRKGRLIALLVSVGVASVLVPGAFSALYFLFTATPAPPLPVKSKSVVAEPAPSPTPEVPPPPPPMPVDTLRPPKWGDDPSVRHIRPSELLALQRKHKDALKACFERVLAADPSLTEIKLEITVSISARGVVQEVKVRPASSPLSTCVAKTVRRWVFPAAGEQTFGFPIIFRG